MRREQEPDDDEDPPEPWASGYTQRGLTTGKPAEGMALFLPQNGLIPREPALKTRASIKANRGIVRAIFGCPDDFVEECLALASKRIPPHA
mgnify:FL=1